MGNWAHMSSADVGEVVGSIDLYHTYHLSGAGYAIQAVCARCAIQTGRARTESYQMAASEQ